MRSDNLHTNTTGNNTLALQWFNMIQAIVNTPDHDVWKTTNFGAPFTDTAPGSDPDGDGVSNREEHAFGLNPTSVFPASRSGPMTLSAGLSYRFLRIAIR